MQGWVADKRADMCLKQISIPGIVYYIPTYAQISGVDLYEITATCLWVSAPSAGSLLLCELKTLIITMTQYNTLVCSYVIFDHCNNS